MKSKLTKSELLLKIAELTNQIQGLNKKELYEIKIFQKAFMKKFIPENDELRTEIEKMISIEAMEAIQKYFPKEAIEIREEGREEGIQKGRKEGIEATNLETAKTMKKLGYDTKDISKITGLNNEKIEKL